MAGNASENPARPSPSTARPGVFYGPPRVSDPDRSGPNAAHSEPVGSAPSAQPAARAMLPSVVLDERQPEAPAGVVSTRVPAKTVRLTSRPEASSKLAAFRFVLVAALCAVAFLLGARMH